MHMLTLPEDVNGSVTFVVYLCFSLLITMANESKISKHKLSEPNRQSYATVHQKWRRRKRKSSKNESC